MYEISKCLLIFVKVKSGKILRIHKQGQLRLELFIWTHKTKSEQLHLGKFVSFFKVFLNEMTRIDIVERHAQILFHLIKYLSRNIRVQAEKFTTEVRVALLINLFRDLDEFVLWEAPLFELFQLNELF